MTRHAELFSQGSLAHFLLWDNGFLVNVHVAMNLRSVITVVCARNEQIKAQVLC